MTFEKESLLERDHVDLVSHLREILSSLSESHPSTCKGQPCGVTAWRCRERACGAGADSRNIQERLLLSVPMERSSVIAAEPTRAS